MANLAAIRSVGASLAGFLNSAYGVATFPPNVTKPECVFSVNSIGGLAAANVPASDTSARVLIVLYRTSMNQHLRNVGRQSDVRTRSAPLSVDLHFLISFWAKSADNEHLVLAWTLRQLHDVPVLDSSILTREAAWGSEDVIQLIPEEIATEELMRIWDTLEPKYRLSVSYIARVIRIDPDEAVDARPVVATRFDYVGSSTEP
jgi:Pvc16 N-terminal domain